MAGRYPSPKTWKHATSRQANRAARSFAALKRRKVPVFPGPLFVGDDNEVELQSAEDVARRVMVLWAVDQRAEGFPKRKALELIKQLDLWDSATPSEKAFLKATTLDSEECRQRVWRLEAIWVLLWALRYVKKLDWPKGMCNVESLVDIVMTREADRSFITDARLRPKAQILDAQDLTMRIHWAIRDAVLRHDGMIPEDLDWSGDRERATMWHAVGVVEQRHYALNWLVNFLDPEDWDHVDTPT